MPSTVNGCGTHYYGKSNVKTRQGVCRRCHREANLVSYDTRLFIVVVFVPVWSLGRKRIIDSCPFCTGHFAISARQWEVGGQLNLSDALTRFAEDPSAESAARAHGQLLSYFQHEEARSLREKALAQLPEDGSLRADLAWQLYAVDQHAEAAQLFDDALRLRPDLPAARAGKSQYLMGQGKLDEAAALLDFLKEPGAGQLYDLRPLLVLFEQLHLARRSDEALEFVPHILQELPNIKDDFWFRKIVRQAESAAGRRESVLPRQNRSLFSLLFSKSRDFSPRTRNMARLGILAAGVLIALALHNESIRRHRTVYVVNQTGTPVRIHVDGGPSIAVDQRGAFTVAEGHHEVQVAGPVEYTEKLAVQSGYFSRWFKKPVWLINVNGEAVVLQVEVVYSATRAPSIPRWLVGETLLAFPHVDYLFDEQPPHSMSVERNQSIVKQQLQIVPLTAESALVSLYNTNPNGTMTMAEKRLARAPDAELLETYARTAQTHKVADRAARFLETGLDRRPIDIAWHRTFQNLRDTPAAAHETLARYEALTQREPEAAAAWYLFARHDPDFARGRRSLERALELDPQFAWALYLQASRALDHHDWEQAEQSFAAALAAPGHDDSWHFVRILSLLVQRKYDAADDECERWNGGRRHAGAIALVRFWSKQQRGLPVDTAGLIAAATGQYSPESATAVRLFLESQFAYAVGNWDALRTLHKNPQLTGLPPPESTLQLISTMSPAELQTAFRQPAMLTDGSDTLAVGLAFSLANDLESATAWNRTALERLSQGDNDDRLMAAALSGQAPPEIDDARNIHAGKYQRPLFFAALAQQFPAQRKRFLQEARLWQILPLKHYWLVEQALQKLGEGEL